MNKILNIFPTSSAQNRRDLLKGSSLTSFVTALEPRYIFDAAALASGSEGVADMAAQAEALGQITEGLEGQNIQLEGGIEKAALALAAASNEQDAHAGKTVVFVDADLGSDEIAILKAGLASGAEMHLINTHSDALVQMVTVLDGYQNVGSVHILSHGSAGTLSLGNADIDFSVLSASQQAALQDIGSRLADGADLLIYGCDFGAGEMGKAAVATLASLTGADIAASDDATGATRLGADWDLEVTAGLIEASLAFSSEAQQNFSVVLENSVLGGKRLFHLDASDESSINGGSANDGAVVTDWSSQAGAYSGDGNGARATSASTDTNYDATNKAVVFADNPASGLDYNYDGDTTVKEIIRVGRAADEGAKSVSNETRDDTTSLNSSYGASGGGSGDMHEYILLDTELNTAERSVLNNALAAKWGFDLAGQEDLYDGDAVANGDYDYDVAGVLHDGTDNVTSNTSGGLTISNSGLTNGQSIFAGHNTDTSTTLPSGIPNLTAIGDREWKFDTTGASSANLTFNLADAGITTHTSGSYLLLKADGSGGWTTVASTTPSNGDVTFNGVTIDDGGVYRIGLTYDKTPPVLNTIALSQNSFKAGEFATVTFTFSEAVSDFTADDIIAENGEISELAVDENDSTVWTATFTPDPGIEDASNVISVAPNAFQDLVGNDNAASKDSLKFKIDTKAPAMPLIGEAANSQIAVDDMINSVERDNGIVITGSAEANTVVKLTLGSNERSYELFTSVGDDGKWKLSLKSEDIQKLGEGVVTLEVTANDSDSSVPGVPGNESPVAKKTITIDTVAPTLDSIVLDDTALKNGKTAEVTFTFSEAVQGFHARYIIADNGTISNLAVDENDPKVWTATFTPAPDLENDVNKIRVRKDTFQDSAGNIKNDATFAESSSYTVDTLADGAPRIDKVTGDNVINIEDRGTTGITIIGTAKAGEKIELSFENVDNSNLNLAKGQVTADVDGKWTANLSSADIDSLIDDRLGEGEVLLTAIAKNALTGAESAPSNKMLTIDTEPPEAPKFSGELPAGHKIAGDDVINIVERDEGVAIIGSAKAGEAVELSFVNNADSSLSLTKEPVFADRNGVWTANLTSDEIDRLGQDGVTISATTIDRAGNVSEIKPRKITIDTIAPEITDFSLAPASDSGESDRDSLTNINGDLTFTMKAPTGYTVEIFDDVNEESQGTDTVTPADSGIFTIENVAVNSAYNDGGVTFFARTTDPSGNVGEAETSITFDTLSPHQPGVIIAGDDLINKAEYETGTVELKGVKPAEKGKVELYFFNGSNLSRELVKADFTTTVDINDHDDHDDDEWSYNLTINDSENGIDLTGESKAIVKAIAIDVAGNESEPTEKTFAIDREAPKLADTNPLSPEQNGILKDGESPILAFNEDIKVVKDKISLKNSAGSSVEMSVLVADNTLEIKPTNGFGAGTYTIVLSEGAVTDLAGNAFDVITLGDNGTWSFSAPELKMTLDPIAGDNIINKAEAADEITITGLFVPNSDVADTNRDILRALEAGAESDFKNDFVFTYNNAIISAESVTLGAENDETSRRWTATFAASAFTTDSTAQDFTATFSTGEGNGYESGETQLVDYTVAKTQELAVDTTLPAAATDIKLDAEDDTGVSQTDAITHKDSDLSFTLKADANLKKVELYNGGVRLGEATETSESGTYKLDRVSLSEGTYTLTVKTTDLAGNETVSSETLTVKIDQTKPVIESISKSFGESLNADESTKDQTITITTTGVEDGNDLLQVFIKDSEQTIKSADLEIIDGVGKFSLTAEELQALDQKEYQIEVALKDKAGVASQSEDTFLVDTVAPDAPKIDDVTGDDVINKAEKDTGVTITGTAEADSTVTLSLKDGNGDALSLAKGQVIADDNGAWEVTLTSTEIAGLGQGAVTLSAITEDQAGNVSGETEEAITIDTEVPTLDSISLSDSELSIGETAEITFTFSEAVSDFTADDIIAENGTISALVQDTTDPKVWTATFTPAPDLENDGNIIRVQKSAFQDLAGNVKKDATFVESSNYTVNTLAAGAPRIDKITGDNEITKTERDAGVTITGTAKAGETVTLTLGQDSSGADITRTGISVTGEAWAYMLTDDDYTAMGQGDVTLTAIAKNAGDVSAPSNKMITIDTEVPTLDSIVLDNSQPIKEDTTVTFTFSEAVSGFDVNDIDYDDTVGTLSDLETYDGIVWTATFTPASDKEVISNTISVADGAFQDIAGNDNAASKVSDNFTIDTKAPDAPTNLTLSALDDSGASQTDGITNKTDNLTLTLNAEAGSTVNLYNGTTLLGEAVESTVSAGEFSYATTSPLSSGSHSITAKATDAAGNESDPSEVKTITIDTEVPTLDSIVLDDTALKIGDMAKVTFTFSEEVPNFVKSDVSVQNGEIDDPVQDTSNPTVWTATFTPAVDQDLVASNTISVADGAFQDIAGNTGEGTTPVSSNNYSIDTQAPDAPTISVVAGDNVINYSERHSTISGTAEAGTTVTLILGQDSSEVDIIRTLTAGATGWSYTLNDADYTELGQGAITLRVTAKDQAGNEGPVEMKTITINTEGPKIESFTSTDGNYKAGDVITISANLNKPVEANGKIIVTLNNTTEKITLTASESADTLTGTYTVAADQDTPDLTIESFSVLNVQDSGANRLVQVDLPAINIGNDSDIVIDTKAPDVSALMNLPTELDDGKITLKERSEGVTFNPSLTTPDTENTKVTVTFGGTSKTVVIPAGETTIPVNFTADEIDSGEGVVSYTFTDSAGNSVTQTSGRVLVEAPVVAKRPDTNDKDLAIIDNTFDLINQPNGNDNDLFSTNLPNNLDTLSDFARNNAQFIRLLRDVNYVTRSTVMTSTIEDSEALLRSNRFDTGNFNFDDEELFFQSLSDLLMSLYGETNLIDRVTSSEFIEQLAQLNEADFSSQFQTEEGRSDRLKLLKAASV